MTRLLSLCVLLTLCGSVCLAQNYRCDWNVVGIAGGSMISSSYRSDATAGQTAVGFMTGTNYQAFIGFWQIDTGSVGVQEDAAWPVTEPLVTMLCAPAPNPSRAGMMPMIRYSLAIEAQVCIRLLDRSGRAVQTLVSARQPAGHHSLPTTSCFRTTGVYFLKMRAGDYQATRKLVLQ